MSLPARTIAVGALGALTLTLAACSPPSRLDGLASQNAARAGSAPAAAASAWIEPCAAVLAEVPTLAPARRVMAVINACRPAGDWTPILTWNTQERDGGPRFEAIEALLVTTGAFCTNAAKQAVMGALREARGKRTERPWRRLGELCKATLSSAGDHRFASAPFYALDRIGRAAAAEPRLAPLLAAIELPLPPWSTSGAGVDLAPSPVTKPGLARVAVTVTQTALYVGTLPYARLGSGGLLVELGAAPYPGTAVPPDAVDARIGELAASAAAGDQARTSDQPIAIVAPSGIRATRVIDALAAISGSRIRVLAVAAPGAPPGWTLLGASGLHLANTAPAESAWLPVDGAGDALLTRIAGMQRADFAGLPALSIGDDVTAAALANLIGALAYHDLGSVALARRGAAQQRTQQRNGPP